MGTPPSRTRDGTRLCHRIYRGGFGLKTLISYTFTLMELKEATPAEGEKKVASDLNTIASRVSDTLHSATARVDQAVHQLKESAEAFDARSYGQKSWAWVKEHPVLVSFVAVSAGMLVGKLIGDALQEDEPTFELPHVPALMAPVQTATDWKTDLLAALSVRAADLMDTARELSAQAQDKGADVAVKARDAGEKASVLASQLLHAAERASREPRAHLGERVSHLRDQVGDGLDTAGTLLEAARVGAAAFLAQKALDVKRKLQ